MSAELIPFGKLNVLIAMQNRQLGEFIRKVLRDGGAENIQRAIEVPHALKLMRSKNVNLFFVDYDFSEHGGPDFVKFIRLTDGDMSEAPVVMILPQPSKKTVMECRDAGVNEILALPVTGNLVESRLKHIYAQPKPFIRSASYIGPCRRREQMKAYHGVERRTNQDSKVEYEPAFVKLMT